MTLEADPEYNRLLRNRHRFSALFATTCRISTWSALAILLVLLLSVAARVNYHGTISAYVNIDKRKGPPPESALSRIESAIKEHPMVDDVVRDIDPSGRIRFFIQVGDRTKPDQEQIRYEDIRTEIERTCRNVRSVLLTFESSESIAADPGTVSAFIEFDQSEGLPTDSILSKVESTIRKHPMVDDVTRDIDTGGRISFFAQVGDRTGSDGKHVLFHDIRTEIERSCRSIGRISLSFDSSESITGWSWSFLTRYPSTLYPERAGILAGIWGSLWLVLMTGLIAVPIGVGAAIYLEEYSSDTVITRLIKLNLSNLAGVPSIVYGILGFTVFVRFFGKKLMLGNTQLLPLGPILLTGALTLALLILPVIIVATQEALKAIPGSIRSASYALGATKWQTIRHQVLPAGMPGIATGVILALSRALGETAPIVVIGVLAYTTSTPGNIESPVDLVTSPTSVADVPFDKFATLPIQIYNWVGDSRPEFAAQAARGILVLLIVLLLVNSVAIYVRNRYQKNLNW